MADWLLDSIEVSGGFLNGLTLAFTRTPGLTCIIGPRGSGKSTLTEAIRYCLGDSPGSNRARVDLIQANLGQAQITIRTVPDNSGAAYTIARRHKVPPTITTADGRPLANVDLERKTFLPIDAYSTLEIEAIADESLGDKRRILIDELQGPHYRDLLFSLSELRRTLEANANAIRNAHQKLLDTTERIEELGDARAKLASMAPSTPDDDSKALTLASKQRRINKQEADALNAALQQHSVIAKELQTLANDKLRGLSVSSAGSSSASSDLLRQASSILDNTIHEVRGHTDEILRILDESATSLQLVAQRLAKDHADYQAYHEGLLTKNAEISKSIQEKLNAERDVAQLIELEESREKFRESYSKLVEERARLKGRYLLERERISTGREQIAKTLKADVGSRVRLRILRNADDLAYRSTLLEGLRGARVRNHEDILAALLRMRPEELAEIIKQTDVKELDSQTSLGEERCRKILEAFRGNLDSLALEVTEIEDRIAVELNVGSIAEPNFKDASELSRGQKCTALLPLLLARRNTPLVIDQPEDNLDNHFIYETVVNSIKRLKSKRQMIFVTHNANIPVLGEADLVVVMGSDGRRGFISKMGSVDDCQGEIVDLLEGGREAFDLRRQRYER